MDNIPTTPEKWKELARTFADTVDREMDEYDSITTERLIDKLPIILSLINSVAALRGQESLFLDIRPDGTSEFQGELYWLEQRATERFEGILSRIKTDGLATDARNRLQRYLVDFWFPENQSL